jgi:tetratricopeptide (TPR) repeat protein
VYRVLGYVDYWARHDIRAARENFGRSIRIQPNSAQTRLWFGSTLSDVGDYEGSLRELRIARGLDPGSKVIQMFYAWSLWLRGPGDAGVAELEDLAARDAPNLTHQLLSEIALSKGDVDGYLDQRAQFASLLRDADAVAYVRAERDAYRRGGAAAFLDLIDRRSPPSGFDAPSVSEVSATLASLQGRRDRLLAILRRARGAGEHWVTWRPDQDRVSRWRADGAVLAALERVNRPITDRLDGLGSPEPGPARSP